MPRLADTEFARSRYEALRDKIRGAGFQIVALEAGTHRDDQPAEQHYIRVAKDLTKPAILGGNVHTKDGYVGLSNFLAEAHTKILEADEKGMLDTMKIAMRDYFETEEVEDGSKAGEDNPVQDLSGESGSSGPESES